ncbi:cytochrome P450 [Cladochytrium replicatum]|nr:cytochrome P450 [Cladochytrium replicatum]
MLSFVVAFPITVVVAAALWTVYLYVQMLRRAAELRKLNPDIPIYTAFNRSTGVTKLFFVGVQRRLGLPFTQGWQMRTKYERFQKSKDGIIAIVHAFGVEYHVANPEYVRHMAMNGQDFRKPTELYAIVDIFGETSILSADGDAWKRHRRVAGPHFSEKNNAAVNETTLRIVRSLTEKSTVKGELEIDPFDFAIELTLGVLCEAAFGVTYEVHSQGEVPPGFHMSFQEALNTVKDNVGFYLLVPKPLLKSIPMKFTQKLYNAFYDFEQHVFRLIRNARENKDQISGTLLSNMVRAVDADSDSRNHLSEQELLADSFIFFSAGHETTANALTFTMTLLALHPEYQERLREEVITVTGGAGKLPEYRQLRELKLLNAVMNESLRMFPVASEIPKVASTGANGTAKYQKLGNHFIPATSGPVNHFDKHVIQISHVALHNNPAYWGPDPEAFRPERFLEPAMTAEDEDDNATMLPIRHYAFTPFSTGARRCIGQRFSRSQFLSAVAFLVMEYKWGVSPKVVAGRERMGKDEIEAATRRYAEHALAETNGMPTIRIGAAVKLLLRKRVQT